MPETIVMKVIHISLDEEDDKDGKPTGKEYTIVRLEEVEPPELAKRWEMTTLVLRDRMADLHLGEKVTVSVEKAP